LDAFSDAAEASPNFVRGIRGWTGSISVESPIKENHLVITVLIVFGTRPEAIKMAPVVRELAAHPEAFHPVVCVTGQHRQMLDQALDLFGIVPDYDLAVMTPGQGLAGVTAGVLTGLDPVFVEVKPDWVLVQGDTTTAMTASLAAFYHRVPVGHVEAGLRTDDKCHPFPEEINRRITSVVADMHFAPTAWAAGNLRREGVSAERVAVTGNTGVDAIRTVVGMPFDPAGTQLAGLPLDAKRLILVTAHRRENIGRGIDEICAALRDLATTRDDVHFVFPVHLNPLVWEPVHAMLAGVPNVTLLPPIDYRPLVWLLQKCHFVITDSGGIQEEAPGLGKPVLVLRETTERPEGVEAGTVRLVGACRERIVEWATRLLVDAPAFEFMARAVNPYGDGHAAEKIVQALRELRMGSRPSYLGEPSEDRPV
jgi:UDP-N-acetylglucosamine 2-epimerase (non-hydrolysing)